MTIIILHDHQNPVLNLAADVLDDLLPLRAALGQGVLVGDPLLVVRTLRHLHDYLVV